MWSSSVISCSLAAWLRRCADGLAQLCDLGAQLGDRRVQLGGELLALALPLGRQRLPDCVDESALELIECLGNDGAGRGSEGHRKVPFLSAAVNANAA